MSSGYMSLFNKIPDRSRLDEVLSDSQSIMSNRTIEEDRVDDGEDDDNQSVNQATFSLLKMNQELNQLIQSLNVAESKQQASSQRLDPNSSTAQFRQYLDGLKTNFMATLSRSCPPKQASMETRPTSGQTRRSLNYEIVERKPIEPISRESSSLSTRDSETPELTKTQILSRLVQIREYLKQAYSMLANIQTSNDLVAYSSQMEKLHSLIEHLKKQEAAYMDLLNSFIQYQQMTNSSSLAKDELDLTELNETMDKKEDRAENSMLSDSSMTGSFITDTFTLNASSPDKQTLMNMLKLNNNLNDKDLSMIGLRALLDKNQDESDDDGEKTENDQEEFESREKERDDILKALNRDMNMLEQLREQKKLLKSIRLRKEELKALEGRRKALEALKQVADKPEDNTSIQERTAVEKFEKEGQKQDDPESVMNFFELLMEKKKQKEKKEMEQKMMQSMNAAGLFDLPSPPPPPPPPPATTSTKKPIRKTFKQNGETSESMNSPRQATNESLASKPTSELLATLFSRQARPIVEKRVVKSDEIRVEDVSDELDQMPKDDTEREVLLNSKLAELAESEKKLGELYSMQNRLAQLKVIINQINGDEEESTPKVETTKSPLGQSLINNNVSSTASPVQKIRELIQMSVKQESENKATGTSDDQQTNSDDIELHKKKLVAANEKLSQLKDLVARLQSLSLIQNTSNEEMSIMKSPIEILSAQKEKELEEKRGRLEELKRDKQRILDEINERELRERQLNLLTESIKNEVIYEDETEETIDEDDEEQVYHHSPSESLWREMKKQLTMRESLRSKKKELEDLIKDENKKSYNDYSNQNDEEIDEEVESVSTESPSTSNDDSSDEQDNEEEDEESNEIINGYRDFFLRKQRKESEENANFVDKSDNLTATKSTSSTQARQRQENVCYPDEIVSNNQPATSRLETSRFASKPVSGDQSRLNDDETAIIDTLNNYKSPSATHQTETRINDLSDKLNQLFTTQQRLNESMQKSFDQLINRPTQCFNPQPSFYDPNWMALNNSQQIQQMQTTQLLQQMMLSMNTIQRDMNTQRDDIDKMKSEMRAINGRFESNARCNSATNSIGINTNESETANAKSAAVRSTSSTVLYNSLPGYFYNKTSSNNSRAEKDHRFSQPPDYTDDFETNDEDNNNNRSNQKRSGHKSSSSSSTSSSRTGSTITKSKSSSSSTSSSSTSTASSKKRVNSTKRMMNEEDFGCTTTSMFDGMRQKIYTEVAAFISQNEARPIYLLNLFKQLKCLNTNQSRYRALKSIYDINSRLFESQHAGQSRINQEMLNDYDDNDDIIIYKSPKRQVAAASTSATSTTGDETSNSSSRRSSTSYTVHNHNSAYLMRRKYQIEHGLINEDSEDGVTASTVTEEETNDDMDATEKKFYWYYTRGMKSDDNESSTTANTPANQFENDSLSNTVIFVGSTPAATNLKQAKIESVNAKSSKDSRSSGSSILGLSNEQINNSKIGNDVKQMISQVINLIRLSDKLKEKRVVRLPMAKLNKSPPVARCDQSSSCASSSQNDDDDDEDDEYRNALCDMDYLNEIIDKVLRVLASSAKYTDYLQSYQNQLTLYLKEALIKYEHKRLADSIEDILIEISDVLFNELTFFTIMSENNSRKADGFKQMTIRNASEVGKQLIRNESILTHCGSSSSSEDEQPFVAPDSRPKQGIELLRKLNSILISKVDKLTNYSGSSTPVFDNLEKLTEEEKMKKSDSGLKTIGVRSMGYVIDQQEAATKSSSRASLSSCGRDEVDIEVDEEQREEQDDQNQQELPYKVITDIKELETEKSQEDENTSNQVLDKLILDSIHDGLVGDANEMIPPIAATIEQPPAPPSDSTLLTPPTERNENSEDTSTTSDQFVLIKSDAKPATTSCSSGSSEMEVIDDFKKEDEDDETKNAAVETEPVQ